MIVSRLQYNASSVSDKYRSRGRETRWQPSACPPSASPALAVCQTRPQLWRPHSSSRVARPVLAKLPSSRTTHVARRSVWRKGYERT